MRRASGKEDQSGGLINYVSEDASAPFPLGPTLPPVTQIYIASAHICATQLLPPSEVHQDTRHSPLPRRNTSTHHQTPARAQAPIVLHDNCHTWILPQSQYAYRTAARIYLSPLFDYRPDGDRSSPHAAAAQAVVAGGPSSPSVPTPRIVMRASHMKFSSEPMGRIPI
jgi:hypothetical protein